MDYEYEDDGHEITVSVRVVVEEGQDHMAKLRELREAIENTSVGEADISYTIDMIPVDEEGDPLF